MTGYLADTNALSEYAKPRPEPRVLLWFEQASPDALFASVVTLGELRLGIEDLPAGKRRRELEVWLATGLPGWFDANLLPVTRNIFDRWAILTIQARRKGRSLGMADGLIAATAIEHGLILITRNVRDFEELSVPVLNLWEPQIA